MKYLSSILLLWLCLTLSMAQDGYFITFTDKNNSPYSLDRPEEFLSIRAIQRRAKQNIAVDQSDLPVNPAYIDSLIKYGIDVKHTSKWMNGAIVFSNNKALMDTLERVPFINTVELNKPVISTGTFKKLEPLVPLLKSALDSPYGESWLQVSTANGHHLHNNGLKGAGMLIAVIDAGFYKANELPLTKHLWDNGQVMGTKDFVNPASNIFNEHYHGMNVLSIIGGKLNQQYMGTATDASFWLLRTEDVHSEHPIEPDYWICAAEFADSAGVDIINTSLGYYEFDAPSQSYSYADMNATSRISRASDMASSKGMLLVTSAGNEGNNSWLHIGAPADAKHCLAIGAVNADSTRTSFSSFGPSSDGRVKPEISALGGAVAVQNTSGGISKGNGTSFSAPVISGLAACLWQAMPDKTAEEIRQLIMSSAHLHNTPNNELGYGIPDFNQAYSVDIESAPAYNTQWKVGPNPFNSRLTLFNSSGPNVTVTIVDILGNIKYRKEHRHQKNIVINEVAAFANGIYIVIIENNRSKQHVKVIKSR
ncbi:S8 family serine peptidase [Carboxylicivirga sediminis]|uniref:S8 family serine peptidase n=1 Tax=Carboxylicivirga sediminis TaxID=2006564 RepID=A0A941IYZ9_9BACT|nr:S8 family serine peptidase [Carboxylicivirga sediminis]MBR8537525.1 S8 family serine peptidase [Carboxylicivirga sediminis]